MTTRNTPPKTPTAAAPSTAFTGLIKKTGGKLGLQSGLGKKKTTADQAADRAAEAETLAALQAQEAAQTAAQETAQAATTTATSVEAVATDTSATNTSADTSADTSTQFSALTEQAIPGHLTAQELQAATQLPGTASTHPLDGSQWAQASTAAAATATDAGVAATAATTATPSFLASAWPALAVVGGGVAALASSGSSAVAAVAEGVGTIIKGVLVAGPVVVGNGLTIQIYDLAGNPLGKPATVKADGSYEINIGNYTGGLIVKVVDADNGVDFRDEATGVTKDLNATFMAVDVVTAANSTLNIHLNAATTIAAVKTGLSASDGSGAVTGAALADKIAAIQAANAAVAAALGITGGTLTGTAATATINADGTPNANANNLGKVLAALSGQDEANGGNMATTIASFAAAITGAGAAAKLNADGQGKLIAGATAANVSGSDVAAILSPAAAAAAAALGTLDAAELAALTPAVAASLTAAQLAAAPSLAVLSAAALQAISPAALAAALVSTPALLATLSATQIAALSADQIAALSPAQIAALDATQIAALNGVQLQALAAAGLLDNLTAPFSAAQLTAASPAGMGLTALGNNAGQTGVETALFNSVLANLTDANQGLADSAAELAAMATLVDKLAQLAALDPTAAGYAAARDALGITAADFAKLGITGVTPANLASVLQVIAASANDGSGITSFTALQAMANAPAAAAAFNPADPAAVLALTPNVAVLLTGAQLGAIPDLTVLSLAIISALSPEAVAALDTGDLLSLDRTQLDALTNAQIAAIAAAGKLGAIDLSAIGDNILGLSDAQLGALTADQLESLTGPQIAALAAAGKFAAEVGGVRIFDNLAEFGLDLVLTAAQTAQLSPGQLNSLTPAQITQLDNNGTNSAFATLSGAQVEALQDDITALSVGTIGAFNTAQLAGLTSTQIGLLASATPSKLTALDATDIADLGTDISALTAEQIAALDIVTPSVFANLTTAQIQALGTKISGLSAATLGDFSTAQLGALNSTQIAALASASPSKLTALTATDIADLGINISGLSAGQIALLSPQQLAGLNDTQATQLANANPNKLGELTAAQIILLKPEAIDSVPAARLASQLTAQQFADLSGGQLLALNKAQITAMADAGKLTALDAADILAIGTDINGLSAAQVNSLSTTQLDALSQNQIYALAKDGDLASLTGAKLQALGTDIKGIDAADLALFTNTQLTDLSVAQIAALASTTPSKLTALTAPQIAALDTDITALTADQVNALSVGQLGGITPTQAAALKDAGDLNNLSAASIKALSSLAINSVPATRFSALNFSATDVAALTLEQVQALTADQLAALNAAGSLDNLSFPLTGPQIVALGFANISTADEIALFNQALHANPSNTGALNLANIAAGVQAVTGAVGGGALTVDNLTALGLTGVTDANIALIKARIDATSAGTDTSLVNTLNELKAIVANASGELGGTDTATSKPTTANAVELADGTTIAVALPTTWTALGAGKTVVLNIAAAGAGSAQSVTYSITQADIDRGYALVPVTQAQALAAGNGARDVTATAQEGGVPVAGSNNVLVGSFNFDSSLLTATTFTAADEGTQRLTADFTVTFSEAVYKGAAGSTIKLYKTGTATPIETFDVTTGTALTGWGTTTLAIKPIASLVSGEKYHITIDPTAIVSINGAAYAGITNATSWNFEGSKASVTLNPIATDGIVNQAESAAPLTIGGVLASDDASVVSGTGVGHFVVTLKDAAGVAGPTATVASYNTATGAWTATIASGWVHGKTYTVTVTMTATGANAGIKAITMGTVTVDTAAPTVTANNAAIDLQSNPAASNTSPAQRSVDVTSTEAGCAFIVKDGTPVTSVAQLDALVSGNLVNKVVISAAGTATSLSTDGLDEGSYHVYTADAAGNLSAQSANTITIDNTAAAPTLTAAIVKPTANVTVQSAEKGTLYLVNSSNTVSNLASITNLADNQQNSLVIAQTDINAAKTLAATGLVDGTYKLYFTDAAGNLSTASTNSIVVDNTNPTLTDANISISGATGVGGIYIAGDTVTAVVASTDANMGASQGNVTVNFSAFGGGTAVAAVYQTSGANVGKWVATYQILESWAPTAISLNNVGNKNISATATDAAGNTTTTADTTNATVDNVDPTAVLTTGITNTPASFNAMVQSDAIGNIAYLVKTTVTTLSRTQLSDLVTAGSTSVKKITLTSVNSTNLPTSGLIDGDYKLYVVDAAGNVSNASANTVTIDTIAPVLAINSGMGDGITAGELANVGTVTGRVGETITVTLSTSAGTVTKVLTGTGAAQTIDLTTVNSGSTANLATGPVSISVSDSLNNFNAPLAYGTRLQLLLNGETANNQTVLTNAGSNQSYSVQALGNVQLSTGKTAFFGGSSIKFDGSGDALVVSNLKEIGTNDFTVQGWFNPDSLSASYTRGLFQFYSGSDPLELDYTNTFGLGHYNGLQLQLIANGSTSLINFTHSINTWNHFVVERASGMLSVYMNGNKLAYFADQTNYQNQKMVVGRFRNDPNRYFAGSLDEISFSNTALYNSTAAIGTQVFNSPLVELQKSDFTFNSNELLLGNPNNGFSGTAAAGSTVTIGYDENGDGDLLDANDVAVLGTATVTGTNWSYALTNTAVTGNYDVLGQGTKNLIITATNAAGQSATSKQQISIDLGTTGVDTLTGSTGSDTIRGYAGADTINLGASQGSDTILYQSAADLVGQDTVNNFTVGNLVAANGAVSTQADIIKFVDAFTGIALGGAATAAAKATALVNGGWVKLDQVGADVIVSVDADGGGNSWSAVAKLVGITLAGTASTTNIGATGADATALAISGLTNLINNGQFTIVQSNNVVAGPAMATMAFELYDTAGNLLKSGNTDATGNFSTDGISYRGNMLVVIKDANGNAADYKDEFTGAAVDLSTDLRAVVNFTGPETAMSVTPLTELATRLMGVAAGSTTAPSTTQVQNVYQALESAFHLGASDLSGKATAVNDATATSNAYGKMLGALSLADSVFGDMSTALDVLTRGITLTTDGSGNVTAATLNSNLDNLLTMGTNAMTQYENAELATTGNAAAKTAAAMVAVAGSLAGAGAVSDGSNAGNVNITGNANANKIFAFNGDDTITHTAGDDLVFGGSGTDTYTLNNLAGQTVSLGNLYGLEKINLTGNGNNTLTDVSLANVLNNGAKALFADNANGWDFNDLLTTAGKVQLLVDGNGDANGADVVTGTGWTNTTYTATANGHTYAVYEGTLGGVTAQLLVDNTITRVL